MVSLLLVRPSTAFALEYQRVCPKCAFVVGIHDARVLSGIRYFQKRLTAFVDADCLKMTEASRTKSIVPMRRLRPLPI
jgi:Cys-tRNA synthase (O-phospho-L-seryl-tRNA:Cys-tRNA synthase)